MLKPIYYYVYSKVDRYTRIYLGRNAIAEKYH